MPAGADENNRVLKDGTLRDNQVTDGSRLVLCPNMESGTSNSHAEHSIMQALKNLSDAQIHEFLSGRSPLTLAIRLGEHLMFVQLQLSTSPTRTLSVQPTTPHIPSPAAAATGAAATTSSSPISSPPHSRSGAGPFGGEGSSVGVPRVNPVSLMEASHNLTEKLKELTHLTQQALQAGAQRPQAVPSMPLTPPPSPPPIPGAVIDSMQHVGKGVYSGTFSGTLDPRLQDHSGQPRRDVNTILHILHDLLVARPSSHLTPPASQPHPNPPPSPRSPTVRENTRLRHKVQHVQRMLEQRRQRRLTRRLNTRPYPSLSSSPRDCRQSTSTSFPFPPTSDPHTAATNTAAATSTATTAASHADNVETANYRKPNMEQETVAV